jgi:hypothetical protein
MVAELGHEFRIVELTERIDGRGAGEDLGHASTLRISKAPKHLPAQSGSAAPTKARHNF